MHNLNYYKKITKEYIIAIQNIPKRRIKIKWFKFYTKLIVWIYREMRSKICKENVYLKIYFILNSQRFNSIYLNFSIF